MLSGYAVYRSVVATRPKITRAPLTQEAFEGEQVAFVCGYSKELVSPDWELNRWSSGRSEWIVFKGQVNSTYAGKYTIPPPGHPWKSEGNVMHMVVIYNVTLNDAGQYTCHQAQGRTGISASANLTVIARHKSPGTQSMRLCSLVVS